VSLVGEERKEHILHLLNLHNKVRTHELVEHFEVSSETIRRYLEELEQENKLKRVYGGAVKFDLMREEPSPFNREVTKAEEKKRIGRAAAAMVRDNDVIVIDDGTTTLQMINYLANKRNLTVLTPSVPALSLLIEYKNKEMFSGDIYFIGGKINAKHYRTSGSVAESMMESFYVDKAFVAVDGLHPQSGLTSYDAERGLLVRKFMEHAAQTVALMDHTKNGKTHFYKISDLKEIHAVICDAEHPPEWNGDFEAIDTKWIVAE